MTQLLPIDDFRWLERNKIVAVNVHTLRDDSETYYMLEVDLGYPHRLHNLLSDLPLALEKRAMSDDMLSPYCVRMNMLQGFVCSTAKVEKLISSLSDKATYIVHYRTLTLYLDLGMKLKAVHRVLSFRQCAWLKLFIDLNTPKHKTARNSFEKDFLKQMNKTPYGKSLDNVRKRIDFHLVADER